jgi:hypothetical protein
VIKQRWRELPLGYPERLFAVVGVLADKSALGSRSGLVCGRPKSRYQYIAAILMGCLQYVGEFIEGIFALAVVAITIG